MRCNLKCPLIVCYVCELSVQCEILSADSVLTLRDILVMFVLSTDPGSAQALGQLVSLSAATSVTYNRQQ